MKNQLLLCGIFLLSGCGTFSVLRPADNLKESEIEMTAAAAIDQIGFVVPALKLSYGLSNKVELGAQFEVYSFSMGARYGVLSSEQDGIALAAGFEAGFARYLSSVTVGSFLSGTTWDTGAAFVPTLTIGRRWGDVELYLGEKFFLGTRLGFEMVASKMGFRYALDKVIVLMLECGVSTAHLMDQSYVSSFEAATGVAFRY